MTATAYRLFGAQILIAASLLLTGCERTSPEQDNNKAQLDEIQQEVRLLIKEVVAINKKLDTLGGQRKNTGSSENSVKAQISSVELPKNGHFMGDSKAQYAMIEFMDYQCPYCVRYAKQVLPAIKKRYIDSGKLQYVIRDYPLNFHSKAKAAAVAANCAGRQSKYWEMHQALIENSRKLSDELYTNVADELGLDMERFSNCQSDPVMANEVDADFEYGTEVGTRGTPNFYIGKIDDDEIVEVINISGARSVESFDRAIQKILKGG